MKKTIFALCVAFVFSTSVLEAQKEGKTPQKKAIGKQSVINGSWQKGGIFEGFSPEQELLERRTQTAKHFKNPNGSITAQIGKNTHYLDDDGAWQDIDLTIVANNNSNDRWSYCNTTNLFKTYLPETSGEDGVVFKKGNCSFTFWKNPQLQVYNGQSELVYTKKASTEKGKINKNAIYYPSFEGILDEIKIREDRIENNIIINQINSDIQGISEINSLAFSQFIPLDNIIQVINDKGEAVTKDFTTEYLRLKLSNNETIYLQPAIIFDAKSTKYEAQLFFNLPDKEKIPISVQSKRSSFIKGVYHIRFIGNGIEISTMFPLSWLKSPERVFPVTVDPTWTIGTTPGSGNFYGPITHWYGYQRYANLYLQSEIGAYGRITGIEYYKTGTESSRTKPTKVYMRTTTNTNLSSTSGLAWNSTTFIGGLTALFDGNTTQDATSGWKSIPLTTPFSYTANNLLIMTYDAYSGSGSAQNMTDLSSTNMQAYKRQDGTDPGDASTVSVESHRPAIRITYSSGDNCSNAIDLTTISSPYNSSTVGLSDDISICRTGYPDQIFYINVPNGYTIDIWESTNNYDEYEYMGWGGSCPGANTINCWDNDALAHNIWLNSTGSTQTVWYVQDGYNGSGTFTLNWTLTAPPTLGCGNTLVGTLNPSGCTPQNASYVAGTMPYWSFTATAGTTYNFSMGANSEDSYLYIYNSSATLQTSKDDNGPFMNGLPASLSWTCPSSGTYYIAAAHFSCSTLANAGSLTYWSTSATYGNASLATIIPTTSWQNQAYSSGSLNLFQFSATSGVTYDFSLCGNTEDSYIRIYNSTYNLQFSIDDNGPWCTGLPSSTSWTAPTTGTYIVEISHLGCSGLSNAGNLQYKYTCNTSLAISGPTSSCSSTDIQFTATPTNFANTPTYQWYYCYSGNCPTGVVLGASSSTGSAPAYTNYSGGTSQTLSVNTFAGSINPLNWWCVATYAGCSATSNIIALSVSGTPSTAPTGISGTTTICNGSSTTLSVSGGSLGTGASWKWYSSSCGGSLVGTGASISVNPSSNTSYFVRAEGTCNNTSCASTTVTVIEPPANDLCANATIIPSIPYSSGVQTNNCATNDTPPAGASSCGIHDYNVWYKFTGNGNQINMSTCNASTTFDTEIHVYTGSCGSMTEFICSDDGVDAGCGTGQSSLTLCTTNGTTYYISVGSYQTGGTTGNFMLTISDKAMGATTLTPNSICGNGTVTLTANVGANADAVDFSTDGGATIAYTDNSTPYQYTTASLTAPQTATIYVRSRNTTSGCLGNWVNSANANAYSIPSLTVQPLCNNASGRKIELIASGGSGVYSSYEQQSPVVSHASNIFAIPFSSTYNYRVIDNHGCNSSWTSYTSNSGPSAIAGTSTGNCIVRGQNDWWHITDASNQVILSIQDNSNNLGSINAWSYIEPSTTTFNQSYYLKRHFKITSQNTPTSNVSMRLYFTDAELNELIVNSKLNTNHDDDVNGLSDLKVTRYSGPNEDNNYANNDFGCSACFHVYSPNTGNDPSLGANVKYVELSVPGFSEEWIHGGVNTTSILPVELLSFNVQCLGKDGLIRWVTASEINNNYFIIERSIDGVLFEQIAQIQGNGNSSEVIEYSYIDTQKPEKTSYYRLKQVDFNGDSRVFNTVSANCNTQHKAIEVIPNPFKDKISITGLEDENTHVQLINSIGEVVYQFQVNASNSANIEFGNIAPGIYLLRLTNINGATYHFKIVKN